jgi:hypothetical protein
MKRFIKKAHPFLLALAYLIFLNSFKIIREAPSIGMIIMFIIGYFKLSKIDD